MKILITGGAGFIGSNLANSLYKAGHEIVVLDNLSQQIHGQNPEENSILYHAIKDKVTFVKGDVTLKEDWLKVINDIDVVVHYAAETGTGQSMYQVEKYTQVNIGGTAILLDLLVNDKNLKVKKVIIASSRSIYGEGKYWSEELGFVYPEHRSADLMSTGIFHVTYPGVAGFPKAVATDEASKIHPSSIYGITKQNQEQMVLCACQSIGIDAVALRYQNVYGPGQSLTNPYTGILSIFSTLIRNEKQINIFEDGLETRDFVYIDDVVDATILSIEKDINGTQIFNVGSGVATDVIKVAKALNNQLGGNIEPVISGNYRVGDIRHNFAELTKIKKHLGFEPKVSFDEGIEKFTKWVTTQNNSIKSDYDNSIEEMKSKGLLK